MEKLDKVIAALTGCIAGNCSNCEYGDSDCHRDELMKDALYWLKLLKEDLAGAHDEIHRLMRGRKEEDMCGTCEYNLKMLREYHVMYLPDTCPRRSSGECPEDNGEVAAAEDDEELKMYIEYRDGEPHSYLYGPSWKAMQLFMEGGYKTPEEAKAAWEEES